jgi:hypothetical protein
MSANRSVQAAQRRRAGPIDSGIPGRGPQPSINSAQMFANQARPGTGPNIPNGRLAGQQVAMQQQQQQQQQQAYQQQQKNDKLSSVSKMTIPQAITLITLRLGSIESKLIHMPENKSINIDEESGVESGLLQSIVSRLESLEKRSSSTTGSVSTPELNLLKQQFETIKQSLVQTKGTTSNLAKDNILLKTQIENLRNELTETKETLSALQNLTIDNTQKILDISTGSMLDYNGITDESNTTDLNDLQCSNFIDLLETLVNDDMAQNEIVGTDLKEMIESELNTDM